MHFTDLPISSAICQPAVPVTDSSPWCLTRGHNCHPLQAWSNVWCLMRIAPYHRAKPISLKSYCSGAMACHSSQSCLFMCATHNTAIMLELLLDCLTFLALCSIRLTTKYFVGLWHIRCVCVVNVKSTLTLTPKRANSVGVYLMKAMDWPLGSQWHLHFKVACCTFPRALINGLLWSRGLVRGVDWDIQTSSMPNVDRKWSQMKSPWTTTANIWKQRFLCEILGWRNVDRWRWAHLLWCVYWYCRGFFIISIVCCWLASWHSVLFVSLHFVCLIAQMRCCVCFWPQL